MVKIITLFTAAVVALLALEAQVVTAHPGAADHQDNANAVAARRLFAANAQRSLASCKDSQQVRRLEEHVNTRRLAKIKGLQDELQRRRRLAASDALAKSHKSTVSGISPSTTTLVDAAKLFGSLPKCVLEPEVTHGPYYVAGELIRNDVRESQPGIDLYTEIQIIDTNTCEPVKEMYLDFWHCNATGVYSGVVANGNGDSTDKTNLNNSFMRGLYPTDTNGLVQFVTKFPGHYAGRASHIHVMGNYDGNVLANKTYAGSSVANIGQIFFDQELITAVEASSVYTVNKAAVTKNANDGIFSQSAGSGFDPIVNYVYIGDSVEDGIFSWISIGVDMKATKAVMAAATWTANGGVASTGGMGGVGGMGGMPGGVPKGPGPQTDGSMINGTMVGHDDEMKPRSALFSFMFFVFSASALGALLYYFPVKKDKPSEKYGAVGSA